MPESTPNYRDLFRPAAIYADKMMVTLRARIFYGAKLDLAK
jgi:hypothetical protein